MRSSQRLRMTTARASRSMLAVTRRGGSHGRLDAAARVSASASSSARAILPHGNMSTTMGSTSLYYSTKSDAASPGPVDQGPATSTMLPDRAKTVIIGGGCIGCGVAYSLVKAGERDVVVLEKEPALANVTTAQAAGLVGQVRDNLERVQLAMWSVQTFSDLQKDPDYNPNWRQVGSLRVTYTKERQEEFKKMVAVCEKAGLHVEILSPATAQKMWPGMNFEKATCILWCPTDGYLQPCDLAFSYQHQSRKMNGAKFITNAWVEDIHLSPEGTHVKAVKTNLGTIKCDTVINAAGAHAYHIAKMVGLELPIIPVRHEYFITEPTVPPTIQPTLPVMRIPDATLYLRPDVNSLLLGGWEPNGLSLDPRSYSVHQKPPPISEDWPVLSQFGEELAPTYPRVNDLGIRAVFSGWPTFTPDGRFIIGPTKKVRGFVMAGGCNAHGVSGSAGIGRHVVESMFEKEPSSYVRSLRPDRFTDGSWEWDSAEKQARHIYETYYHIRRT